MVPPPPPQSFRFLPLSWHGMQPFRVAEVFTNSPGRYVNLKDTIEGFSQILAGQHDDKPESAFYMVGGIEEVAKRADEIAKDMAAKQK